MIQLQVCFCLLGLALAALGVAMLLRPQRLRRFLRRLDARLWKWTGRRLAWSRLAGSGLLLLGSVHIGEVQASVWDKATREACAKAGIPLL